jgi:hypothetical protein
LCLGVDLLLRAYGEGATDQQWRRGACEDNQFIQDDQLFQNAREHRDALHDGEENDSDCTHEFGSQRYDSNGFYGEARRFAQKENSPRPRPAKN